MHEPLKIGLIGAGTNTVERHIPGFRALPGVDLAVVANRSVASSQRVADAFQIPRVAGQWQDIVADESIDAVCIGTWPYLHAEITCAALAAGKHVLTEARMARDLPEAEQMLAASLARPDLVAQVVPSPMTLPLDRTIRRMIVAGDLGELREVCVTQTTAAGADANSPFTWRQDSELSGHNTMALGIYYEAVLRWMQADVRVEAAAAAINIRQRKRADGGLADIWIPDSLTVLGRYETGTRLVMHHSGVELGPARNEMRINGAKGSLRVNVAAVTLHWTPLGGVEQPVTISPSEFQDWQVEADFVNSIRTGAPVRLTDFPTGVRTMRFTDEVWQAWSKHA
jgi:predicted dehydrogenase